MNLRTVEIQQENERYSEQLTKAKETLRKIGVEGAAVDEVMRADIRRMLNEWDGSDK